MPSLFSQAFKDKFKHIGPQPFLRSYLLVPPPSAPIQPAQYLSSPPPNIPPSCILLTLTHPDPSSSAPTAFFLSLFPEPLVFAQFAAYWIHRHLTPSSYPPNQGVRWRTPAVEIALEDKDGLAATGGGRMGISLRWIETVMKDVQSGKRPADDAMKEFKGVVLHELVHTIQHDGFGSTPTWFTESVADYVRILANLGPSHWKRAGQANRDRGWETGYDVGAHFFVYLTGAEVPKVPYSGPDSIIPSVPISSPPPIPHSTRPSGAQPTRISHDVVPPPNNPQGAPERRKRGPFPELVALMDARLEYERWSDNFWVEMTGAPLEVLWTEYLDYYA